MLCYHSIYWGRPKQEGRKHKSSNTRGFAPQRRTELLHASAVSALPKGRPRKSPLEISHFKLCGPLVCSAKVTPWGKTMGQSLRLPEERRSHEMTGRTQPACAKGQERRLDSTSDLLFSSRPNACGRLLGLIRRIFLPRHVTSLGRRPVSLVRRLRHEERRLVATLTDTLSEPSHGSALRKTLLPLLSSSLAPPLRASN